MTRLLLGIALSALTIGSALAADLPVKARPVVVPLISWTGFYVGVNVGGHWASDDITTAANPVGWGAAAAAEINARSAASIRTTGVIAGAQLGYNWQTNNWVWGLEADANWLSGTARRTLVYTGAVNFNPADAMTNATRLQFLATVRGRIGIVANQALIYATGGLAIGSIEATDTFCSFGCPGTAATNASVSATTTRFGWTLGGGVEYRISTNYSVKAEYLYVDLGSFSTNIPSCTACAVGSNIGVNHSVTDHIARAGLNYRF